MHVLRQTFESLGFSKVATFLASGNIVFEARAKGMRALEKKIERKLQQTLGYNVPVFIRKSQELNEIATLEPFKDSRGQGVDVNIIFLVKNLDERSKAKLKTLATETDGFRVHGREVYWWRRKRPGTSLYSNLMCRSRGYSASRLRSAARARCGGWPRNGCTYAHESLISLVRSTGKPEMRNDFRNLSPRACGNVYRRGDLR
jgi:uncharacterized protein (DUF1697 family)